MRATSSGEAACGPRAFALRGRGLGQPFSARASWLVALIDRGDRGDVVNMSLGDGCCRQGQTALTLIRVTARPSSPAIGLGTQADRWRIWTRSHADQRQRGMPLAATAVTERHVDYFAAGVAKRVEPGVDTTAALVHDLAEQRCP